MGKWNDKRTSCRVVEKGIGAWNADFFTTDPTGNFLGNPGGVKSAILGTIEIVALAWS